MPVLPIGTKKQSAHIKTWIYLGDTMELMKVKYHVILTRCIEDGISMGWKRAHKHTDTPEVAKIHDAIALAIDQELNDVFDFSDEKPAWSDEAG